MMDLGSGGATSTTGTGSGSGSGAGAGAGVADLLGGVIVLLFAASSARAAARAGSFLFLSIIAASRSGCAKQARVRHIFIGVERFVEGSSLSKLERGVLLVEEPVGAVGWLGPRKLLRGCKWKPGKNGWSPKENGPCRCSTR